MRIPWNIFKGKTDNKAHNILKSPKSEQIDNSARYFILDKGCPGDTKILVKFDGSYWRWIQFGKKWVIDETITKEDWSQGHLHSITKEEAEKIFNS